jgi:hypothetical protein
VQNPNAAKLNIALVTSTSDCGGTGSQPMRMRMDAEIKLRSDMPRDHGVSKLFILRRAGALSRAKK